MKRELHLNLFINGKGHHEASWRHIDASPIESTDIKYLVGLSKTVSYTHLTLPTKRIV